METLRTTVPVEQSTDPLDRPNQVTTPISDYRWGCQPPIRIDKPNPSPLDDYLGPPGVARLTIESLTQTQPDQPPRCFRNQPLWPRWVAEPRLTRRQIRKQHILRKGSNGL